MIRQEVQITNTTGMHARPAAKFVKLTNQYKSKIKIELMDKQIDAKSMLNLLSAGICKGTTMTLIAEGEDEVAAMEAAVLFLQTQMD